MAPKTAKRTIWALARRQHWVVTLGQLRELGFGTEAVRQRVATGRLHRIHRGVYAVGRPELTRLGHWMAAVLACGEGALLSHESAAALWGVVREDRGPIDISVASERSPRHAGIRVHRRRHMRAGDATERTRIPVTTPVATLVDIACTLSPDQLEAAIREADKRDLVSPPALRGAIEAMPRRPGIAILARILDHHTFRLTDSDLERRFLRIVQAAGLPLPETQVVLNGYRVDFYWPDLGLVVETDGLRYHRTAAQQARDAERSQAHAAAGLTSINFTHAQVRYGPERVEETLTRIGRRIT